MAILCSFSGIDDEFSGCSVVVAAPSPPEADVDIIGISYFGNDYTDKPMDESRQQLCDAPKLKRGVV